MSVSPEKEKEYQLLIDCFRSGQMSEADMNERLKDDIQFTRFVFKHMKIGELANL